MSEIKGNNKANEKAIPPDGCPCCKKDCSAVNYDNIEIEGSIVSQRCYCYACGYAWWELYEFIGIEYDRMRSTKIEES